MGRGKKKEVATEGQGEQLRCGFPDVDSEMYLARKVPCTASHPLVLTLPPASAYPTPVGRMQALSLAGGSGSCANHPPWRIKRHKNKVSRPSLQEKLKYIFLFKFVS